MKKGFFQILIEVLTFRNFTSEGIAALFVFGIISAVIVVPLIKLFETEEIIIDEFYCYRQYENQVYNGIAVKYEILIPEFISYLPSQPESGDIQIPNGSSFRQNIIEVKVDDKIQVYKYVKDSSFVYASMSNPWYDPKTTYAKERVEGYIPIYLLHKVKSSK